MIQLQLSNASYNLVIPLVTLNHHICNSNRNHTRGAEHFGTLPNAFAPMIMGIAFFTSIRPAAVIEIIIDVLVEEDCTNTVARTPRTKPAIGLSKIS